MVTRIQKRPDRGTSILYELETHFGRSYTVDMVMMALGYKEFERSATRQAVTDLNRHGKITRTSRGRYMAVQRYRSGVTPVDTAKAEFLAGGPAASLRNEALAKEAIASAELAGANAAKSETPAPAATPLAVINDDLSLSPVTQTDRPIDVVMNAIGKLDNVQIIGRNKTGDKWIGIGLSDGTVYLLEEL